MENSRLLLSSILYSRCVIVTQTNGNSTRERELCELFLPLELSPNRNCYLNAWPTWNYRTMRVVRTTDVVRMSVENRLLFRIGRKKIISNLEPAINDNAPATSRSGSIQLSFSYLFFQIWSKYKKKNGLNEMHVESITKRMGDWSVFYKPEDD